MEPTPSEKLEATAAFKPQIPEASMDQSPDAKPTPYDTRLAYGEHQRSSIIEHAQDIGKYAVRTGKHVLQSLNRRMFDTHEPSPDSHSSRKARIIAAGGVAATGIGLVIKKRRQQSEEIPEKLVDKAKNLIHSR
jgi:hypothetical protein